LVRRFDGSHAARGREVLRGVAMQSLDEEAERERTLHKSPGCARPDGCAIATCACCCCWAQPATRRVSDAASVSWGGSSRPSRCAAEVPSVSGQTCLRCCGSALRGCSQLVDLPLRTIYARHSTVSCGIRQGCGRSLSGAAQRNLLSLRRGAQRRSETQRLISDCGFSLARARPAASGG
jgi:hypothetical protein